MSKENEFSEVFCECLTTNCVSVDHMMVNMCKQVQFALYICVPVCLLIDGDQLDFIS